MLSACTSSSGDASVAKTPAVAPDAAQTTAATAVGTAATSSLDATAAGAAAREKAFVGAALQSANAYAKTLSGRTAAEKAAAELSTTGVKVLAISRGGDTPQQVLAQTTLKKTGAAVLVLLVGGQGGAPFKAAAVTPMLPGGQARRARPHDRRLGRRRRRRRPERQARRRRRCVRRVREVPEADRDQVLADDPLSQQLRQSAAAQSQALNNQGAFTQEHDPKGIVGGLRLKDGKGAIVFAHLVRSDAIAMRSPVKLTPAKDLTLLTGIKQITSEASLTSNEIIAIVIPASGPARIVAASDQLVAGSGR